MKKINISYFSPWNTMFEKKKPSKSFCKEMSDQLSPVVYDLFEKEEIRKSLPKILFFLFDHPSYFNPYVKDNRLFCWASIMAKSEPLIMCHFIVEWYCGENEIILPWMDVDDNKLHFQFHISQDEKKHLFSSVDMLLEEHYANLKYDFPFHFKMTSGGDTIDFCFREDAVYETAKEIETLAEKAATRINSADNPSFFQIDGIAIKGKHILVSVESDRCAKEDVLSFISSFVHIKGIRSITLR